MSAGGSYLCVFLLSFGRIFYVLLGVPLFALFGGITRLVFKVEDFFFPQCFLLFWCWLNFCPWVSVW